MPIPSLVTPSWTDLISGTGAAITLPALPYTDPTYTTAVVVIALRDATQTVDSVSFGAAAMTKRKEVSNGTDIKISIWDITGAALGTVDVVATLSGSSEYIAFCSFLINTLSYRGGDTSSGTSTSATIATSAGSGTLLIGIGANDDAAASYMADIANQTPFQFPYTSTIDLAGSYKTSRDTGASFGWTLTSKPWVTAYVEYNQLPLVLAVDASASPTLTDNVIVTPSFVCRETTEIYETDSVTVEVIV